MEFSKIKSLIETHCHKRNLSATASFISMGFTGEDMLRVNQVLFDRYHHHVQIYLIDSIEDVVRIINENF